MMRLVKRRAMFGNGYVGKLNEMAIKNMLRKYGYQDEVRNGHFEEEG